MQGSNCQHSTIQPFVHILRKGKGGHYECSNKGCEYNNDQGWPEESFTKLEFDCYYICSNCN
jgi:hypothetical protein